MRITGGLVLEVDKIKKAVIPAAGLGSRFYPLTRMYPKELLPVVDKPVIHYVVEEALNSGIEEILIIVGPQKQAIINYFYGNEDEKNFIKGGEFITPDVNFVCQREPRGLADSLAYAKKFVGSDPFLVLLGDTFYESYNERTVSAQIIETYLRWKSPVVAIEKIGQADLSSYGVVDAVRIFENVWNIKNFIEKPSPNNAPSDMGMVGIYVLEGEIFDHLQFYFKHPVGGHTTSFSESYGILLNYYNKKNSM